MRIIDITRDLSPDTEAFPGDPKFDINLALSLEHGDPVDVARVSLGTHFGTHLDAQSHLITGGETVDQIPLSTLTGPATVVDISGGDFNLKDGLDSNSRPTRALLKTGRRDGHLRPEQVTTLIDRGVDLIGIDSLSIDPIDDESLPSHRVALENGVAIVESLDLTSVSPGDYFLVCLPLKIVGTDGAPVRAILIEWTS